MAEHGKLIWSWSSKENERPGLLPFPLKLKYFTPAVVVLAVTVLPLLVMYPLRVIFILIPGFIFTGLILFYQRMKTRMAQFGVSNEQYIRIYLDGIDLNTTDYRGFYKSEDIDIQSLQVRHHIEPGGGNVVFEEMLHFNTISPAMKLHVRLPMPTERRQELKQTVEKLKQANKPSGSE